MADLRTVIIDDDAHRRESIKNVLPDYIATVTAGFGEGAIEYIKPDTEGTVPDLVILYGDDPKSFGLYIFDWMVNKSGNPDIESIPVIVITEDEFSDRCLEFLEIGDVTFYEGDVEDGDLFSVVNEVLEEADFAPEPLITSYEETKNIDRLMGLSVKAPAGSGKQRAVVLDMESRIENLEAALERGRKRVNDIRTLIDAAQKAKDDDDFRRKRGPSSKPATDDGYVKRMSSFLEKARKKTETEEQIVERIKSEAESEAVESIGKLREKAMSNPYGAFNAQGTLRMEERPAQSLPLPTIAVDMPSRKKTVVIVDDDVKTRKLCSLFLTQKYNVITFDSGMKTIDYFVQNTADLLIINPVLGGMSGVITVSSVRNQRGGANIQVMYLVGDNYMEPRARLLGQDVVGILNKPIKQQLLSQAVDGFFDNRR